MRGLGDQEGHPQGDLAPLLTPVLWWALILLDARMPQASAMETLGSLVLPQHFALHEDQDSTSPAGGFSVRGSWEGRGCGFSGHHRLELRPGLFPLRAKLAPAMVPVCGPVVMTHCPLPWKSGEGRTWRWTEGGRRGRAGRHSNREGGEGGWQAVTVGRAGRRTTRK